MLRIWATYITSVAPCELEREADEEAGGGAAEEDNKECYAALTIFTRRLGTHLITQVIDKQMFC